MRLAAWIPAIRATAATSPFGASPAATLAAASGDIRTTARARAQRSVSALALTSTIVARPAASRWVSEAPSTTPILVARQLQECARQADARAVTRASTRTSPAVLAALSSVEALTRALAQDLPLSVLLLTDTRRSSATPRPRWEERGYDVDRWWAAISYELLPEDMHGMVREHYEAAARGEVRRFALHYGPGYRATLVPVRAADGTIAGALALAFDEGEERRAREARAAGELVPPPTRQQAAVARLGELAPCAASPRRRRSRHEAVAPRAACWRDNLERRPARARSPATAVGRRDTPAAAHRRREARSAPRTSTSCPRSRTCSTAPSRASARRSASATTRCTTRSPASRTARC